VSYVRRGLREQRTVPCDLGRSLDFAVPGERTDVQPVI